MTQLIKIASWNINSVRFRIDIVERFLAEGAEVILSDLDSEDFLYLLMPVRVS